MAKFFVLLMPVWFACGACLCGEFPSALLMPGRLICVFECFVLLYPSVARRGGLPVWRLFILYRSPSGACNFHTASVKRRFHK